LSHPLFILRREGSSPNEKPGRDEGMTNCGLADHGEDCLCDVKIVAPVPTRFRFTEVWGADVVASALGYKGGGYADLADFLEALAMGYDATRRLDRVGCDFMEGGEQLTKQVKAALGDGHSIVDLPDILGESFSRIVGALTSCKPHILWTWDEQRWIEFECHLLSRDIVSLRETGREFGLEDKTVAKLVAAYGRRAPREGNEAKMARIRELFAEHPDWTSTQIHAQLTSEGHQANLSTVKRRLAEMRSALVAA
jgi:hypothetical protein